MSTPTGSDSFEMEARVAVCSEPVGARTVTGAIFVWIFPRWWMGRLGHRRPSAPPLPSKAGQGRGVTRDNRASKRLHRALPGTGAGNLFTGVWGSRRPKLPDVRAEPPAPSGTWPAAAHSSRSSLPPATPPMTSGPGGRTPPQTS